MIDQNITLIEISMSCRNICGASKCISGTEHQQASGADQLLVAQNLTLLARLSYEQRNHEQAESFWKQALAIIEKTPGLEHPALAEILNDLAGLYFVQGNYSQAQSLCSRAFSIAARVLGSEHPDSIVYREHLNRILLEMKQDSDCYPAPPTI